MYPVTNLVPYDLEVYPNYFLAGFQFPDGTVYQYRISETVNQSNELKQCLEYVKSQGFTLCGYNSSRYDDPVLGEVLQNPVLETGYNTSVAIIEHNTPSWNLNQDIKSIDLMQIMRGRMSLKKAGVCLAHPKLQELPFNPHQPLTPDQQVIIDKYNVNDLLVTRRLQEEMQGELDLRSEMSANYNTDLRSKGDATIAEVVLCQEYEKVTGVDAKTLKKLAKQQTPEGSVITVEPPTWWEGLRLLAETYPSVEKVMVKGDEIFHKPIHIVGGYMEKGALASSLFLADRWYTLGVGGLHSVDGSGSWVPREGESLVDVDVTSYYPNIMITQNLYPTHWGREFIDIFKSIVARRTKAKAAGDKVTADTLKIVANGTYGKTSDKYSALYSPYTTANVTVRGQLSLLLLVAMLNDNGHLTVSANTDGVTVKTGYPYNMYEVVSEWEKFTGFDMEYTDYSGLYQLDVNNYIALTTCGKLKTKGRFQTPKVGEFDMTHTPNYQVCARAVQAYLSDSTPLGDTVRGCTDIQDFILTQQVRGEWAVSWQGEELGKMLRFYKSTSENAGPIIRTPLGATGNLGMVTESDSCTPVADLPGEFPTDIDYTWYLNKGQEWLDKITKPKTPHMNNVASLMISNGITPCLVDTTSKRLSRAKPPIGGIDFTSMGDNETLGVATGPNYKIMAKRDESGKTLNLYKVQRDYPSKTRTLILKNHGFELIYGGSVPFDPYTTPVIDPDEPLEQYYTPSELSKVK